MGLGSALHARDNSIAHAPARSGRILPRILPFFCERTATELNTESHQAHRQHEHHHTSTPARPPDARVIGFCHIHTLHKTESIATFIELRESPPTARPSSYRRVSPHGACRRRLCARTGIDATTHSHMGQGHAARRHRTVTLSYSHADDSACTLTSPAASGCPTAAHVTLPHASGVMSLDRDN